MTAIAEEQLTLGLAATRIGGGVQHHHLHRLCRSGAIPFTVAGRVRLVRIADLPAIRAECEKRGYVQPAAATKRGETTPAVKPK